TPAASARGPAAAGPAGPLDPHGRPGAHSSAQPPPSASAEPLRPPLRAGYVTFPSPQPPAPLGEFGLHAAPLGTAGIAMAAPVPPPAAQAVPLMRAPGSPVMPRSYFSAASGSATIDAPLGTPSSSFPADGPSGPSRFVSFDP